jgi:hypothetical protein
MNFKLMKRLALQLLIAIACVGFGRAAFRAASSQTALSKYVPAGPLLYLEAKDFSSLLGDWNASPQKRDWLKSDNYEVFSRSRLFLRLKAAGDQFTAAAGLPPNMDLLSQVAGQHSVLAIYDIGKLQFLYVTYLPSVRSMQTTLWQTRAKFEPRNAGGVDFYLRRDPESQREVAFAISGDYLLLATREDLMAGALQLIAGQQDRTVENDSWWAASTAASGEPGDLRMALNLQTLVPNGYFRTYWIQQNITDLSQYSAAVSDLFRAGKEYREERVLIRKKDATNAVSADGMAAVADLSRLVPDHVGLYATAANPTADACFTLLESKLLAPHLGPAPVSKVAPQVQLTSGEQGSASDLETRIDQAPAAPSDAPQSGAELKGLLGKHPILASLQVQSSRVQSSQVQSKEVQPSEKDQGGVFVTIHSAVVLAAASDWDGAATQAALAEFVRPGITASSLGVNWVARSGYQQLDGLWPLAVSVHGKYLLVSDDATLMESLLGNFSKKPDRTPAELLAGFNHDRERTNFARFMKMVDQPSAIYGESGSHHRYSFPETSPA